MIKLDPSQLPSDITNALMLRGADVLPLLWQERPNTPAKALIESVADDEALFRGRKLVDESMCAAVRALLYLWNGWHAECEMYAQAAPEAERDYLRVFALRQRGCPKEVKLLLRQIDNHPVYGPLCEFALETITVGSNAALNRMKEIIKLGEAWEPFAFADLYEQARAANEGDAIRRTVCVIQCREFELLFARCFEQATGEPLTQKKEEAAPRRRLPKPTPKPKITRPPNPPVVRNEPRAQTKPALLRQPGAIGVACPKCHHLCRVPEAQRGKKQACPKCNAAFLVPVKSPATAT